MTIREALAELESAKHEYGLDREVRAYVEHDNGYWHDHELAFSFPGPDPYDQQPI